MDRGCDIVDWEKIKAVEFCHRDARRTKFHKGFEIFD